MRTTTMAKANPLYPRSKRDDIIIYAINKKMSLMNTNAELSRHGEEELK